MPEVDVRLRSQAARISSLTRALSADLEPAEVIDIVVTYGMAGLDAESGLLALIRGEWVVPICAVNTLVDAGALPLALDLPIAVAARSASAVWVHSRAEASSTFPDLLVGNSLLAQAWAALPLSGDGGHVRRASDQLCDPAEVQRSGSSVPASAGRCDRFGLEEQKTPAGGFRWCCFRPARTGERRSACATSGGTVTRSCRWREHHEARESPRRLSRSRRRRPKSLRNDSGVFPATTAGSSWRMQA